MWHCIVILFGCMRLNTVNYNVEKNEYNIFIIKLMAMPVAETITILVTDKIPHPDYIDPSTVSYN